MRAIRALAPARAQFAPTGARLRVLVAALSPNPPARAGISGADAADPGVVSSAPRSRTNGYARFGARRLLRLGTPRIPICGARPVDPGSGGRLLRPPGLAQSLDHASVGQGSAQLIGQDGHQSEVVPGVLVETELG